jgi:hypothetical protein
MAFALVTFDGSEEAGLPEYTPACRERRVGGLGSMWVHGYTLADSAKWRGEARMLCQEHTDRILDIEKDPPQKYLDLAQVVAVCRTGPGAAQRTFTVTTGGRRQACEQLLGRLPGKWLRAVCTESDNLALDGYLPPDQTRHPEVAEAVARLGEQLADRKFWTALSYLTEKLFGIPVTENHKPIGEVLTALRLDMEAKEDFVRAIGAVAGFGGGEG